MWCVYILSMPNKILKVDTFCLSFGRDHKTWEHKSDKNPHMPDNECRTCGIIDLNPFSDFWPIIFFQGKYKVWGKETAEAFLFGKTQEHCGVFPLYISYKKEGMWFSLILSSEWLLLGNDLCLLKVIGKVETDTEPSLGNSKRKSYLAGILARNKVERVILPPMMSKKYLFQLIWCKTLGSKWDWIYLNIGNVWGLKQESCMATQRKCSASVIMRDINILD